MLEPITSALFVSYLACLPVATRKPDYFHSNQNEVASGILPELETRYTITKDFSPVTDFLIAPQIVTHFNYNHLEAINNEIDSYHFLSDGWDGDDSYAPSVDALNRAKNLLGKLPSGIANPIPMISKNGNLGLYWSNDFFYADLHLEDYQNISLYIRKKIDGLDEFFFDNLPEDSLTTNWIKENASILYLA
ncbi:MULTISPECIES: hypothetical protein [Methylotenera]|uniref:hypothetical protein n=1 Tax=Methylotenera TaxID=359407 RepID=UPI00035C7DEE|nr:MULTISPECIES: hypothetical protein [Methylotenera]